MPKSHIPADILDQAIDWLVILNSGDVSTEQRQQYEQWRTAYHLHALAMQQLEQSKCGFGSLAKNLQAESIFIAEQQFKSRLKRNQLLSLGGLFLIGLSFYAMSWPKWHADDATHVGEIKTVTLADGSTLTLASDSYINIKFTEQQRQIELVSGEIYIQTAKDPLLHRPFIVTTKYGKVQALGTQFSLRHERNHQIQVNVYQHAVAITPMAQNQAIQLQQGHIAFFNQQTVSPAKLLLNTQPYWTQHLLVVENWPLKKVLAELYRYKQGTYFIEDEIQDIQVSGVFSLKNIEKSLETLAYSNALELNYYSQYLLKVKNKTAQQ